MEAVASAPATETDSQPASETNGEPAATRAAINENAGSAVVTAEASEEQPTPEKVEIDAKTDGEAGGEEQTEEGKNDSTTADEDEKKEAAVTNENEVSGEVKAKRTKKEKIVSPPPVRSSGREQRVRKTVDAFDPAGPREKKNLVIPEGKGQKLEDMPRVVANFKNVTWSDPHLKMLYTIVFGRGQKKDFKSHLLQFNGLVYSEGGEEEEREKIKLKMYKLMLPDLKEVMDLCDIDRSAESFGKKATPDKEMLCDRLLEWLENPKANGKSMKAAKVKTTPSKKATPSKTPPKSDSAKKRGRPKGTTTPDKSPAKKAKGAAKAEVVEDGGADEIDFNIPGTTIEKVREKVKSIVENANREELTVKGVRKILEDWLDTDLSDYKDAVRSLVMEAM
jgi:hypothetical protein